VGCLHHNVAPLTGRLVQERFGLAGLPAVVSRRDLTRGLAEVGSCAEGISIGHEAVQIAEAADHPYSRIAAYSGVGLLALEGVLACPCARCLLDLRLGPWCPGPPGR
jgi:hypothetical protein